MYKMNRLIKTSNNLVSKQYSSTFSRSNWLKIDDKLFGLTDEEQQLRQLSHKFFKQKLDPLAKEIDANNEFSNFKNFMKECGQMGFLGLNVPEKFGGLCKTGSNNYMKTSIINEEITRISAGISLSFGAHIILCTHQILKHGTEEQKLKYLPDLTSGETIGALAMSEHNAGSDVMSMKTTAVKEGDYYVINGTKSWITNGPIADIYVVYTKTSKNKGTAFIIDRRECGDSFKVGNPLNKLGIRGSPTGELIFNNCKVHKSQVLGQEGAGFYILFGGLNIERILLAASPIGLMQACNDVSFSYAHERRQFGQIIGKIQLIQGKMADMYVRLSTLRAFVYNVTRAADKNYLNNKDSASVMLMAGEYATQQCLDAVQILGGNGYTKDYPVERFLRDAKLYEIGAGTSEVRRWLIGREINKDF